MLGAAAAQVRCNLMTQASPDDAPFALNPHAAVETHRIGHEGEPVLVLDGVMRRPQALVDYAATEVLFEPSARYRSGYPGLLGPAPLNYVGDLVGALRPLIEDAFGLEAVTPARAQCNFSLVTLRPEELSLEQRLPHVDRVDPLQFAILHFLCDEGFGGTGFYRHRATGFESLTAERDSPHREALARELADAPPPAAYVTGDTALYARTAVFEAKFDRVIVYRSRVFHSGQIRPGDPLSADPRQGRLTSNIFLNFRPV
jgi:hypothetical protein